MLEIEEHLDSIDMLIKEEMLPTTSEAREMEDRSSKKQVRILHKINAKKLP